MKKIFFKIDKIKCNSCVSKITDYFSSINLVTDIDVNLEESTVLLCCDDSVSNMSLKEGFSSIGFEVLQMAKH